MVGAPSERFARDQVPRPGNGGRLLSGRGHQWVRVSGGGPGASLDLRSHGRVTAAASVPTATGRPPPTLTAAPNPYFSIELDFLFLFQVSFLVYGQ